MTDFSESVRRIVKVNHAGEYGAIRIYKAQLYLSQLFFKDTTTFLSNVLKHEESHCKKFEEAMRQRNTKPCRTMWLWSLGGFALGLLTAAMGRNMILVCTEAVEDTVHKHMNEQISFLKGKDEALKNLVEEIKVEEIEHLDYAQKRVTHNAFTRSVASIIGFCTNIVIWLSTHGDSSRLSHELKEAGL